MLTISVHRTISSLRNALSQERIAGKRIGFVPTMGALHQGHITLVDEAKERAEIVVVSIFVNPTQFNNPEDLKKYPRTEEQDVAMLEAAGVNHVFLPGVDEMYPADYVKPALDLGIMDRVMEGKFRPGHFDGVVEVVKRFFDIVEPDFACFGKKDFQQLAVIQYMVKAWKLPVSIVPVDIVREPSGLAMSSRNQRLSAEEKHEAVAISRILSQAQFLAQTELPHAVRSACISMFKETSMELEYLEIVDSQSLEQLDHTWSENATCCIAAYCGDVRLIDNIELK